MWRLSTHCRRDILIGHMFMNEVSPQYPRGSIAILSQVGVVDNMSLVGNVAMATSLEAQCHNVEAYASLVGQLASTNLTWMGELMSFPISHRLLIFDFGPPCGAQSHLISGEPTGELACLPAKPYQYDVDPDSKQTKDKAVLQRRRRVPRNIRWLLLLKGP